MREMIECFAVEGTPILWQVFGSGHINQTWLVVTNRPHLYILQNISTAIFRDPVGLMNNILLVTDHLRRSDPDPRHVLTLVPLKDGRPYLLTAENELWRMYEFVTGGICLEQARQPADFQQSGVAFGQFQRRMADFAADRLTETIPRFHDTPNRYRALHRAIAEDRMGRAAGAEREITFLLEREEGAGLLQRLRESGELPVRVTHNDTKLNNVMLDEKTGEPLCILDLDTVMPGLAAYDFGDAIRFGASTAPEDETDLNKVHLDLTLYAAFASGFLGACGKALTETEIGTLPDGARIITLENAVRFLTDYLEGDTYFHIDHPEHNLQRARTQIALAAEMERMDGTIRRMMDTL